MNSEIDKTNINNQSKMNEDQDNMETNHHHEHSHHHEHGHSEKSGGKKKLGRKLMNIIRQNPNFTKAEIVATGILSEAQVDKAISKVTEKGFLKMEGEHFIIDEVAFKQYHQDHHPEEGKGKGCKGHHNKETKFSSFSEINIKL